MVNANFAAKSILGFDIPTMVYRLLCNTKENFYAVANTNRDRLTFWLRNHTVRLESLIRIS